MLTIYGVYTSRASRTYWLAEELGIPFTSVPVIQGRRLADPLAENAAINTQSPAYLAINPMGQIPFVDDDGLKLQESLAINLHLARKHGGPLAAADASEESLMTMWSFWAATEAEVHSIKIVKANDSGQQDTPEGRALINEAVTALKKPLSFLNERLSHTGFVVADRFTVADINVSEVLRYAMSEPTLFEDVPHVRAWLETCHARPAFKAMMARRAEEIAG